jgi:CheY-like chemotaxis protein
MEKRILLVDSDPSARKMLARVLELCGYFPVSASNHCEAVEQFCAAHPVLAILDLNLEEQEGWTAWSRHYADAMRRGIDALAEKPLDIKALLEMIEHLTSPPEQHLIRSAGTRALSAAAKPLED